MMFEFWLSDEHLAEYVQQSAKMRSLVATVDGFVSIEGFASKSDPRKVLALAYFRDEEAVQQWRNSPQHRAVQQLGRSRYFTDYRLRMAEVVRDYTMQERQQAPSDSRLVHG